MKKLLVLTLVLGMASLASAGMALSQTAPDTALLSGSGYDIVGGEPEFAGAYVGFYGDNSGLSWTGLYAGDKYSETDISSMAGGFAALAGTTEIPELVMWFDFADTTPPPSTVLPNGDLVSFVSTTPVTLVGLDANEGTNLGTVELVPEPATLALLGLGGLLLRRRK